jgi:hypothetical protein
VSRSAEHESRSAPHVAELSLNEEMPLGAMAVGSDIGMVAGARNR